MSRFGKALNFQQKLSKLQGGDQQIYDLILASGRNSQKLEQPCNYEEISRISPLIKKQIEKMKNTAAFYQFISLSPNQVGINNLNLFIVAKDLETNQWQNNRIINKNAYKVIINPRISAYSSLQEYGYEQCLIHMFEKFRVKRYEQIEVQYQNENLEPVTKVIDSFEARVYQHEIDHLNGEIITSFSKNDTQSYYIRNDLKLQDFEDFYAGEFNIMGNNEKFNNISSNTSLQYNQQQNSIKQKQYKQQLDEIDLSSDGKQSKKKKNIKDKLSGMTKEQLLKEQAQILQQINQKGKNKNKDMNKSQSQSFKKFKK
ncbi:Peptide deformylase [Pseudocohnilembus persalinus]|uniref:Peptide deformylase n=1 Tax=Pseudocohnilembus persalinus TaxID=266149 RepID=A0A0V0R3J8_PSEPJ|nr:Peptide deformylase [Pseudocohnilembus persalinus]|eukprot:KRX09071.1 Peptide deformylase [Pseudocohnilembus persalinus]